MPTTTCITYLLIAVAMCATATAQFSPTPAPESGEGAAAPSPGGVDCFQYLIGVSDCLTFVEGGSNLTKPDPGCCPELANLVNTQPVCLCQLLGNPGQTGISVDVNRALQLPSVCNVTTPPVSLCAAIGVPVGGLSPSEAPAGSTSSGLVPSGPSPSPDGEAAAAPTTGGNNGSPTNLPSKLTGLAAALLFFSYLF